MVESISTKESATKPDYEVARRGAGLVDRSSRGTISVAGRDRRSFLHALLTNDIETLGPGTGCYAAYLTPQGRMIADMRVLELGDRILLDVHPDVKAGLLRQFDDSIFTEDVQVSDATDAFAQLGLRGPRSAAAIAAALGDHAAGPHLASLSEYRNERRQFAGGDAVVVRDDEYGEMGFDLYVDRSAADQLRDALIREGARLVGEPTQEILRVETGRPAFHVDMDEQTIPLEAGLESRAISMTKGCYVGQEVIVRVLHRGHGRIARKLVGLVLDGTTPAAPGDRIEAGAREGVVTSAVISPRVGGPIALGYVHREAAVAGTAVAVLHDGARLAAKVVDLPFRQP
jgi:folate-binding protein YgfZ